MLTPFVSDTDFTLWNGDVRDVLAGLPAESVDCCVTSPPYWGLRDYGTDGQLGLESTPEEYVARMVEAFLEVRRVLRPGGTCWLNLGDSYIANAGTHQVGQTKSHIGSGFGGPNRNKHPMLKPKDLVGIPWRLAFALQQPYYTGRIKDERDRIWLAAMIDAEGCIFVHKRKVGQSNGQGYERKNDTYGSGLEISNTSREIVERALAIVGKGSISTSTRGRNQPLYRWNLRTNECRGVLREVYPHLVAKQHQARLAIGCPSSGKDAEAAHGSLIALHNGDSASIDFPAPTSMLEPGWYLRADVIWSKSNPMPESVTDRPTKAHEYLFLLTKSARYFYDADAIAEPADWERWGDQTIGPGSNPDGWIKPKSKQELTGESRPGGRGDTYSGFNGRYAAADPAERKTKNKRSVWTIATEPYPAAHFATFPQALVEPCILAGCPAGGTVLDPFMGSGTTALVARRHGRKSIGIELNESYCALAAKRLGQQSLLAEGTA